MKLAIVIFLIFLQLTLVQLFKFKTKNSTKSFNDTYSSINQTKYLHNHHNSSQKDVKNKVLKNFLHTEKHTKKPANSSASSCIQSSAYVIIGVIILKNLNNICNFWY